MANFVNKILLWSETIVDTIPTSPKCYALKVESFGLAVSQNSETNSELGNGRGASAKSFGTLTIGGDLGMIWNTDNAPILMGLGIGKATNSADATADLWVASVVTTIGTLVNHSDGLHTLTCLIGGTTDATTEPDLSAYVTSELGRGVKIVDATVTWIIMPKLFAQVGVRADCLSTFGVEVEDNDACTAGAGNPEYSRFNGLHIGTLPFAVSGSDMSIKSTVNTMGMTEEDSLIIKDAGGVYEEMSAKAGFTEQALASDYWFLEDLTFSLNGVKASIKTTSFSMNINNTVSMDDALNKEKIENTGIVVIDGTLDIIMDNTMYADAATHKVQSATLEFKKANGTAMSLNFPQFLMERSTKVFTTDKTTMLSIPMSAFDTTAKSSVTWSTISPISFNP